MNDLAIHLYLIIRYINLSFNYFCKFYRIIVNDISVIFSIKGSSLKKNFFKFFMSIKLLINFVMLMSEMA